MAYTDTHQIKGNGPEEEKKMTSKKPYGITVATRNVNNTEWPIEHTISSTGKNKSAEWVWNRNLVQGVPENGVRCFPTERQAVAAMLDYLEIPDAWILAEESTRIPEGEKSTFLQGKYDAEYKR